MRETLLHYLWQCQYFDRHDLCTTQGEPIVVHHPGVYNPHAGADFQQARIRIGSLTWVGSVEMHVQASLWKRHGHDDDAAYENVILHVVWYNDQPVLREDGSTLPTLVLHDRVSPVLLERYRKLINSPDTIPCSGSLHRVRGITLWGMMDRALAHRLQGKSDEVMALHERNHQDWEETCYQVLARNFGFKVNAEPFLRLAQRLPLRTLLKHGDKLEQVEAMLFGMSGLLPPLITDDDDYTALLRREYKILRQKFNLKPQELHPVQWRFMRLRPANFPTIRMAQFAALVQVRKNLFSQLMEAERFEQLVNVFLVSPSSYWQRHYQFGRPARDVSAMGRGSIYNLIINTAVPLLVAYSKQHDEQVYMDRALGFLHRIPSELNHIIAQWTALDVPVKSAFDSQSLIELYNSFCLKRRCLDCNIGAALLKPDTP